jgi:predicted O-methyltransferase YrrM
MRKLREQEYLIQGLNDMCLNIKNISKMVEIGSYIGESTEIFAQNYPNSIIYCVDPWQSGYDTNDLASMDMGGVEDEFDKRMEKYNNVFKIKKTSIEASYDFENNYLDFIYIDANHTYESVVKDIEVWLPKIKKDGYIGFHDYDNSEVKRAINEKLGEAEYWFEDQSVFFKI